VRRLAALAVTIALAWFVITRFSDGAGPSAALGLGLTLLAAGIVGWLCQFVRLPRITGYLLLGLLCGPSLANIITDAMARDLQTVSSLAVVVIGLIAGLQFNLRRTGTLRVAILAGLTVALAWVALAAAFYALWPWLPIAPEVTGLERVMVATFAATLLLAGSPAVTVAVIAEGRARGPLADLASEVVVVMQVTSLVLLAAWQGLAALLLGIGTPRPLDVLVAGIWSIGGSVAFGTAVGAAFTLYLRNIGRELTLMLFVVCLVLSAITAAFGFEPFVAGLAAGLVVQNVTSEVGAVLYEGLEHAVMPVLVLFFAALGASVHIEAVAVIGAMAIAIAAIRVFILRGAIAVSARVTGESSPAVSLLWRALVPTAGATIGVAAAVMALADWGTRLQAPVLAVVAVTQIIGPIVFRAALSEAGEIGLSGGGLIVV
jgi:Kef-type K+ transport system membrane component KefB